MKNQLIVLITLNIFVSCKSNDRLSRMCGNIPGGYCYAVWNNDGYMDPRISGRWAAEALRNRAMSGLVGECKFGTPVCDDDFNITDCIDPVYPATDRCDGLDNNCDGTIDNGIYPRTSASWVASYGNDENPCISPTGVCAKAAIECVDGKLTCLFPDNYEESETRCDALDNDCDGMIDENVFDSLPLSDRVCYSGNPLESYSIAPCRPGILHCARGEIVCDQQVVPDAEVCDGVDNDCNGIIDDTGKTQDDEYDVVFVIDTSYSMCDEIGAVSAACDRYAMQFDGNNRFKFAIVVMSEFDPPHVIVDTDFTDFSNIRDRLNNINCDGYGAEASLDSMQLVCDKDNNKLNLSWRESASSIMFVFTDEEAQSYTDPLTSGSDVIDTCTDSGTLPYIWSKTPNDFAVLAAASGGRHFDLVNYYDKIVDDMNTVIISLCANW